MIVIVAVETYIEYKSFVGRRGLIHPKMYPPNEVKGKVPTNFLVELIL